MHCDWILRVGEWTVIGFWDGDELVREEIKAGPPSLGLFVPPFFYNSYYVSNWLDSHISQESLIDKETTC